MNLCKSLLLFRSGGVCQDESMYVLQRWHSFQEGNILERKFCPPFHKQITMDLKRTRSLKPGSSIREKCTTLTHIEFVPYAFHTKV